MFIWIASDLRIYLARKSKNEARFSRRSREESLNVKRAALRDKSYILSPRSSRNTNTKESGRAEFYQRYPFSRPYRAPVFRFAPFLPPWASADGFRSFRPKVAFLPGRAILIAVLRLQKITAICDNIASCSLFEPCYLTYAVGKKGRFLASR